MDNTTLIPDLPIATYKNKILEAVDGSQVTIITAETGAGKSTQVPQYLAEHGYTKVIVTQPRILAARNLSTRVREEWALRTGKDGDGIIGYRTAHERDDNPETQILYCTDGLQLVRELTGIGTKERQVLILDEVHEWNENMEVLVAWARKRCQEEPHFKVVIMSATIETDTLAQYFDTTAVISVPGRGFPVAKRRGTDVISEIVNQLATTSSNMLVFLPGKAEIQNVTEAVQIKADAAGVPIIPLHSQLEATAQQQAFASYPNGKIILATNIAQTSVTIDDVDVVIDSGLERRSEVRNGVEGLFIAQISQADCLQRAGRAGRTKAGEYILAPYDTMPCLPFEDRPEYATPEILRKHIDRLTLRLASVGIDIEVLDFYHDPSNKAIARAKRTLVALGALTRSGDVTRIGRQMEQFPVESSYGRMLVEVMEYGQDIQAKLAAVIAIQEVGGIVKGGPRYTGWRKYTRQTKSDLLAEYDVFLTLPDIELDDYEEIGIIGKNVTKAREVRERLTRDLGLTETELTPIQEDEQDKLLRSIVAGQIDQLWTIDSRGNAVNITTEAQRELSSTTVVRHAKLVAGTAFDLQIPTHSGGLETLHLVQGITAVNTNWLVDLAPESFKKKNSNKLYYDPLTGRLVSRQLVRFKGQVLEGYGSPIAGNGASTYRAFAEAYATWAYGQQEDERRRLGRFRSRHFVSMSSHDVLQQVKSIAGRASSLVELSPEKQKQLTNLSKLQAYNGQGPQSSFSASSHHEEDGYHQKHSHRGWLPSHKRKYNRRKDVRTHD